jgi:hypothetical protein
MAKASVKIQGYPRRDDDTAANELFPRPKPINSAALNGAIKRAYERCLLDKKGEIVELDSTPEELVSLCLAHLKERSDPILNPYFLSRCKLDEIFELDAVAHEMQRHLNPIVGFFNSN